MASDIQIDTNFEIFKQVTEQEQQNVDDALEQQKKEFLEGKTAN